MRSQLDRDWTRLGRINQAHSGPSNLPLRCVVSGFLRIPCPCNNNKHNMANVPWVHSGLLNSSGIRDIVFFGGEGGGCGACGRNSGAVCSVEVEEET